MSLIVEDGTAKLDAESLASVEFADDYFDKRGNTAWLDLDTSAKEAALRIAADYIETHYGTMFRGYRVNPAQALSWPRAGAAKTNVGYTSDFTGNPMRMLNAINVNGYGTQFIPTQGQAMAWQNNGLGTTLISLYQSNEVPLLIKKATAELAWRASQGPLLADIGRTVEMEKIGDIEVKYDKAGPKHMRYPAIEALISPLMQLPNGGGNVTTRMVRV